MNIINNAIDAWARIVGCGSVDFATKAALWWGSAITVRAFPRKSSRTSSSLFFTTKGVDEGKGLGFEAVQRSTRTTSRSIRNRKTRDFKCAPGGGGLGGAADIETQPSKVGGI